MPKTDTEEAAEPNESNASKGLSAQAETLDNNISGESDDEKPDFDTVSHSKSPVLDPTDEAIALLEKLIIEEG